MDKDKKQKIQESKKSECKCKSCQVNRLIKGLCEIRLKHGPYFY